MTEKDILSPLLPAPILNSKTIRARHDMYNDARKYYFAGTYTQTDISVLTGVPRRTLHNWIKEGQWEQLRHTVNQVPALILENLIAQLTGLQKQILEREETLRFPTHLEAETQRKLILAIKNIRDYPAAAIRAMAESMSAVSDIVLSGNAGDANEQKDPQQL